MSTKKMMADSTVTSSELQGEGRKRKKSSETRRKKKARKSGSEDKKGKHKPADSDSDLDLNKEMKPMGGYIKDRQEMLEQIFHTVRGPSLQRALPDILRDLPLEELKRRCLEQLEIMSRKRIRRILQGDKPDEISSSGTEEESTASMNEPIKDKPSPAVEDMEGTEAENSSGATPEEYEQDGTPASGDYEGGEVESKNEQDMEEGEHHSGNEHYKEEEEPIGDQEEGEIGDESAEEARERGEESKGSNETEDAAEDQESEKEETVEETIREGTPGSKGNVTLDDGESVDSTKAKKSEAGKSSEGGGGGGDDLVLAPVFTLAQMEILELEMRARAIKAMLRKQPASKSALPEDEQPKETPGKHEDTNEPNFREKDEANLKASPKKESRSEIKLRRRKQSRKKKDAIRAREEGKKASKERTPQNLSESSHSPSETSAEECVPVKSEAAETVPERKDKTGDIQVKTEMDEGSSSGAVTANQPTEMLKKEMVTDSEGADCKTTEQTNEITVDKPLIVTANEMDKVLVAVPNVSSGYTANVSHSVDDFEMKTEGLQSNEPTETLLAKDKETSVNIKKGGDHCSGQETTTEPACAESMEETVAVKTEDKVAELCRQDSYADAQLMAQASGNPHSTGSLSKQSRLLLQKMEAADVGPITQNESSNSDLLSKQPENSSSKMEVHQIDQNITVKEERMGYVPGNDTSPPCLNPPLSVDNKEDSEMEEGEVVSDCEA